MFDMIRIKNRKYLNLLSESMNRKNLNYFIHYRFCGIRYAVSLKLEKRSQDFYLGLFVIKIRSVCLQLFCLHYSATRDGTINKTELAFSCPSKKALFEKVLWKTLYKEKLSQTGFCILQKYQLKTVFPKEISPKNMSIPFSSLRIPFIVVPQ